MRQIAFCLTLLLASVCLAQQQGQPLPDRHQPPHTRNASHGPRRVASSRTTTDPTFAAGREISAAAGTLDRASSTADNDSSQL